MSRFEEMETFVEVVRANSLSGAAQRMAIAVSAVSRRLRQLENRLGTRLLQRSTRQLGLTESGRSYYEHCLRILADVEEVETNLTCEQKKLAGRLRIATPLSFGNRHLCPAIAAFVQQHPQIHIDVDMDDRQVDLVGEGFDLAIRIGKLQDSSLVARRIAPAQHVVCAAPAFFKAHGLPRHPEDIQGWPALCYANLRQPEHWFYRKATDDDSDDHGRVVVEARITANNGDFLLNAAIAGLGVICEPSFIVNEAVQQGLLQVALCDYRWYDMAIYIVYPSARHRSARVRHFVDFLVDRFGPEPYWEACCRQQPSATNSKPM